MSVEGIGGLICLQIQWIKYGSEGKMPPLPPITHAYKRKILNKYY
jgi:hypothetical protein